MGARHHTDDSRARVIEAFRECGRIDLACKSAGVSRDRHYDWLKQYPEYKQAFDDAQIPVADLLEDEAKRRALEGLQEPRTVAGKKMLVRVYSDRLLEKLLEARHPAYKLKNAVEISGPGGAPLAISVAETIRTKRQNRMLAEGGKVE